VQQHDTRPHPEPDEFIPHTQFHSSPLQQATVISIWY